MGFVAWIVFGAIVGWAANLVVGGKYRRRQGCLVSILVGVVGAALGGLLYKAATGREKVWEFDFPSMGVAAIGAVVLLVVVQLIQAVSRKPPPNNPR